MQTAPSLIYPNIADYVIIGVVLISAFVSLFRGFLKELVSLFVWIVGFWLAIKYYTYFAATLVSYISNETTRNIVSFCIIFLSAVVAGAIINKLMSHLVTLSGLGGTDRFLGVFFGAARGILLISVLLLVISTTSFSKENWYINSVLISYFGPLVDWLRTFLTDKIPSVVALVKSPPT